MLPVSPLCQGHASRGIKLVIKQNKLQQRPWRVTTAAPSWHKVYITGDYGAERRFFDPPWPLLPVREGIRPPKRHPALCPPLLGFTDQIKEPSPSPQSDKVACVQNSFQEHPGPRVLIAFYYFRLDEKSDRWLFTEAVTQLKYSINSRHKTLVR